MTEEGETVVIDLAAVRSSAQLLAHLGQVLELGGPNGNVPASAANNQRGWGMNWNALYDCLTDLDVGGIWGTSHKFRFPLHIRITSSDAYRAADAEGFATFSEILAHTRQFYATNKLVFDYTFS